MHLIKLYLVHIILYIMKYYGFIQKGHRLPDPSTQVDRSVTYNYVENTWSTMSLARTTYADSVTYDNPYATEYDATTTPQFPTIQGVTNKFGSTHLF